MGEIYEHLCLHIAAWISQFLSTTSVSTRQTYSTNDAPLNKFLTAHTFQGVIIWYQINLDTPLHVHTLAGGPH